MSKSLGRVRWMGRTLGGPRFNPSPDLSDFGTVGEKSFFLNNILLLLFLMRIKVMYGENFMTIFTTLSAVIWFSPDPLGIFATLVYVFTIRVVIYGILSMAIIPTLSTCILFCNLCYILS